MGIPVFFVFDYERDLCRARLVTKTWTDAGGEAVGCWDKPVWDAAQIHQRQLYRLVDEAISKAVATVVLVTQHTADQKYVQYALRQSHAQRKQLLGIYVHRIPDEEGKQASLGHTRFGEIGVNDQGQSLFFWQLYPSYRWVINDGPRNLPQWISRAAAASGSS